MHFRRNTQGKTPLHMALDHDKLPDGCLRIVDSLLSQPNIELNVQDNEVCFMIVYNNNGMCIEDVY